MRIFVLVLAGVGLVSRVVSADPNTTSFSAFDLAMGKLGVNSVPNTAEAGPQLAARHCTTKTANGVLTIERTMASDCHSLFDMRQPHDLGLDIVSDPRAKPQVVVQFNLLFDAGMADLIRAEYEPSNHRLDLRNDKMSGTAVYFSLQTRRWLVLSVAKGIATLASSEDIAPDTIIYFRTSYSDTIVAVTWTRKQPDAAPPKPEPFKTTCRVQIERAQKYQWVSYVDTANPTASLEVIRNPSAPGDQTDVPSPIVEPSSFGLVVVRHAEQLVVAFDSGSAALTLPGISQGVGQSGADTGPTTTKTKQPAGPKYVCSTHQVPPHAPGPFQVKLKMVDPSKTAGNTLSERNLDVIVLQRYAGAFRAGVAAIFGAPDQKFEARTSPGSTQAEVVRTGYTPVELVLGYSIYFTGLCGPGRSYFTKQGVATQDSHWGAYLGFGVVSVTSNSIDYLKSLHLGIEYEFSPYFALAVTGVIRRVDELAAGAQVGGPAGNTIPTQSSYVPGVAVVLNISPSFFRFTTQIVK
jgi:hypothetical protein